MEREDVRPLHPLVNEKNDLQRGRVTTGEGKRCTLTYACWQELTSPFLVVAERSDIYC